MDDIESNKQKLDDKYNQFAAQLLNNGSQLPSDIGRSASFRDEYYTLLRSKFPQIPESSYDVLLDHHIAAIPIDSDLEFTAHVDADLVTQDTSSFKQDTCIFSISTAPGAFHDDGGWLYRRAGISQTSDDSLAEHRSPSSSQAEFEALA